MSGRPPIGVGNYAQRLFWDTSCFGEPVGGLWPDRAAVPSQETREEVTERVLPALQELASAHPGESLLVVSHGGAIRAVLMAVQPDASHGAISNGSVHSFRFAGSLELIAFDDPLTDTLDQQNALEAREEGVA